MLDLIVGAILLCVAFVVGTQLERRHYRSLIEREQRLLHLPAIASRRPPADSLFQHHLVMGSTVVSVDYFKRFLATLRMLFGGNLTSYESLLDRARREALVRMKLAAQQLGATHVFNVKYETTSISKGRGNQIGSVEMLAYGTALVPHRAEP